MSSAIPATVTALCALARTAFASTTVGVHDGKPVAAETPDWIAIGYDPASDEAVAIDWDWGPNGQLRKEEDFAVLCTLRSGSGDEVILDRRLQAFAMLHTFAAALAADYSLGGLVRVASINGSGGLSQAETGSGAAAGLRFRVECEGRIAVQ